MSKTFSSFSLRVCSKGWGGRTINNKKARGWTELISSWFCHEALSLLFENFFSCDRLSPHPCFDQMPAAVGAVMGSLLLPLGTSGFGFQCTDRPVHKQQWGGWLCLCRTRGDQRVTSGPAISMHECSRCSSQGKWEPFRVTLNF